MPGMPWRNRGVAAMSIILILAVAAISFFLSQKGIFLASLSKQHTKAEDSQKKIQLGLLQFVQSNSRLPCPANPALDVTDARAGYPDQNSAYPAASLCTYPGGIVPWKVLGLTADDITDSWGGLISYRVYDGSIGLTQANGMTKVNCDLSNVGSEGQRIAETAPTSGLCHADTNTLAASFTRHASYATTNNDKGFIVTDNGVTNRNVAYILISHGSSGMGAYVASGSRNSMPDSTTGDYANTQAAPTAFVKLEQSLTSGNAQTTAGYYDDVVAYLKIDELARVAGLDARNWPERAPQPIASFDSTTTNNLTNTTSTTQYRASINTTANVAQQFQATASSSGTSGGAVYFGAAAATYSSCLWSPVAIDLYRASTAIAAAGTSWSSNVITFTTTASHGLAAADTVEVGGASPTGYNGTYAVVSVPTSTSLTVSQLSNPGSWVAGGSIRKQTSLTTGTAWSGGITTYTTTATHGLATGNSVVISNASPSDYNGTYTVVSVPSSTTLTVSESTSPGTWTSGGTVVKGFSRALMVAVEAAISSTDAGAGLTVGFLPTTGTYLNATSSSAITLNPTLTITGASYNSTSKVITFTHSGTKTFTSGTGNFVIVSGASASGYNGTYAVVSVPSATTFTVSQAVNPGTWTSGGTVTSSLCGSSTSTSRIGWENSTDGNLPTPRFAVELDMQYNNTRGDPNNETHIAVDYGGITHAPTASFNAATCSASASTYNFTSNSISSLSGTTYSLTSPNTWSAATSRITFKTSATHGLAVGNTVVITGASPTGYNGTYAVVTVPSTTTFTVSQAVNPGTWTSGGTFLSGIAWSASVITFKTAAAHGLSAGTLIAVNGASPNGYNGTYAIASVPTTTSISVSQSVDPGAWASGGSVTRAPTNSLASGTAWSGGVITFTTALNHNLATGNRVAITGTSPAAYDGSFTVLTTPSATTFTVASASDPGTWVSGGGFGGNDCYTNASSTSLMNGITNFHSLRVELEPASPACNSSAPLVKFWLLPYNVCHPTATFTGASYSGGVITFTTSSNHGFASGNLVTITGASPNAYNGTFTIAGTPTLTTFTASSATDPGVFVSGGTPATLTTGTSYTGGVITFTTASAHGFTTGNAVTIAGASPNGYNGTFTITSVPSSTTFTATSATSPGTWSSGGSTQTLISADCASMQQTTSQYQPTSFPSTGVHLLQCVPTPNPSNAFDSVYFGFTSNTGTAAGSTTNTNFVLQNLSSGLLAVP